MSNDCRKAKHYSWNVNVFGDLSPDVAGDVIASLIADHGDSFRPQHIVDAARERSSPLHDAFVWDDKAAAEAYRVSQAGLMLRSLKVSYVRDDSTVRDVRAFVSVQSKSTYKPIACVLEESTLRAELIERAKGELRQWTERYKTFEELSQMRTEIIRWL